MLLRSRPQLGAFDQQNKEIMIIIIIQGVPKKYTFKILRAMMGGQNFGQKWPKVAQSGPNGSKWPKVAQNSPKWPKQKKWPKVAQNGPKWPKVAQSGPKWPKVAPGVGGYPWAFGVPGYVGELL